MPVWREVLADLETPVSAFVKLAGAAADDPAAFLLESVEHGERWGRFSFIGRDPALTMVVRGNRVEFDRAPPAGVPTDQGALAALEALLATYRAPTIAGAPAVPRRRRRLPRLRRRARDRAAPQRAATTTPASPTR